MTEVASVSEADFAAEAGEENGALAVRMAGNADLRVKDQLDGFLDRLHHAAVDDGIAEVALDLRGLEFMNSTCFKSVLTWIGRIQALEEGAQYRIRILSNPEMYWQRRSLHALSCFATDLITVEE